MLYKVLKIIIGFLANILYKLDATGQENIPQEGAFILCANHIHNFDPVMLAIECKRPIHYMAKKELFSNKILQWFFHQLNCIEVNRDGNDLLSLKKSYKVLKSGEVLGIFPEGTRTEDDSKMLELKGGTALIAIRSKTPLVPVHVSASYRPFSKVNISFGKPFTLEDYYGKKLPAEEYDKISNEIIKMKILELRRPYKG